MATNRRRRGKRKPIYDFHFADPGFTTFMMLRHTWHTVNKATTRRLSKSRLTVDELAVLWASRDYPGDLTPTTISRLLAITTPTVVTLLDRMERQGLINITHKDKGHPFTEIKITSKGERVYARGIVALQVFVAQLMSDMSPEQQEQLQHLLRSVRDHALEKLNLKAEPVPGYSPGQVIPLNW